MKIRHKENRSKPWELDCGVVRLEVGKRRVLRYFSTKAEAVSAMNAMRAGRLEHEPRLTNMKNVPELLDSILAAVERKDWKACADYTLDAIQDGRVVRWEANRKVRVDYAAWQAGDPASFSVGSSARIVWKIWTVPSPTRRIGNHWTGGNSSTISEGAYADIPDEEMDAFLAAMRSLVQ